MGDLVAGRGGRRLPVWAWVLICLALVALVAGIVLTVTGAFPMLGIHSTTALVDSGRAHLEANDLPSAISDLSAAIEEDPASSQAHFLLGQAYSRSGDPLKAADEFRAVLELDPENAAAHHNLGVTYFQLEDPSSAISEFEAALKIDPDDADTHYQLGATYLTWSLSGSADTSNELLAEAVSEFERALNLREDIPEALIGIANIRIHDGQYAEAIDLLQRAIAQLPESREAHYALAQAYARSGQVERGCEVFDIFLSLSPPAAWQSQAREQMSAIGCD